MKNSDDNKYYFFTFDGNPEIGGVMSVAEARLVRSRGKVYGLRGKTPSASTLLGTIANGVINIHH